ncbi:hypothetical protein HDU98_004333, partial [Podochytrium sp. JEL0797]
MNKNTGGLPPCTQEDPTEAATTAFADLEVAKPMTNTSNTKTVSLEKEGNKRELDIVDGHVEGQVAKKPKATDGYCY